jgi:hypothetical protein
MFPYNRLLTFLTYVKAGKAPRGVGPQIAQAGFLFCMLTALTLVVGIATVLAWCFGDWTNIGQDAWSYVIINGGIALGILVIIFWRPKRIRMRWVEAQKLIAALNTSSVATMPELDWVEPASQTLPQRGKPLGYLPELQLVPSVRTWERMGFYTFIFMVILGFLSLAVPLQHFASATARTAAQFTSLQAGGIGSSGYVSYYIGAVLLTLVLFWGESRRLWADADGLRWRRGWHWERLPWSDVRALGVYSTHPQNKAPLIYLIASEQRLIAWINPRYEAPWNRHTTKRMLSLAMAYTNLPLRNLTPLGHGGQTAARAGNAVALHAPVPISAETDVSTHPTRRSLATAVTLCFGLAVLILAPIATETLLEQRLWPAYLASLPQTIAQQQPIFTDALRVPDGRWPAYSANFGNPTTYTYSAMGYTISGDGAAYAPALLPTTYGAVAIQVTVHNLGRPGYRGGSPFPVLGAGIVMRADTEFGGYIHYCAFEIDGTGKWGDTDAYQSGAGNGYSPDIQTGPGNVNTLFVIARGLMHSMYVNGHYLGTFTDEFGCPPVGQIGLVNDSGNANVAFTDFKVWSVTAPPAFMYR